MESTQIEIMEGHIESLKSENEMLTGVNEDLYKNITHLTTENEGLKLKLEAVEVDGRESCEMLTKQDYTASLEPIKRLTGAFRKICDERSKLAEEKGALQIHLDRMKEAAGKVIKTTKMVSSMELQVAFNELKEALAAIDTEGEKSEPPLSSASKADKIEYYTNRAATLLAEEKRLEERLTRIRGVRSGASAMVRWLEKDN